MVKTTDKGHSQKLPIYFIEFPNRYLAAATCLRFQEHYESPKFRGQIFSLEQYMDWYAKTFGNFTYYQDWKGFNFPSSVLKPFYSGEFEALSTKEQKLLEMFRNLPHPYYIIGSGSGRVDILRHEFVHGLYFVNDDYRAAVDIAVSALNTERIKTRLRQRGYCEEVTNDEINAYSLTGYGKEMAGLQSPTREKTLHTIFIDHFKCNARNRKTLDVFIQGSMQFLGFDHR